MEYFDGKGATGDGICRGISVEPGELVSSVSTSSTKSETQDLTFSAFMVADVTMSFKSRRRERTDGFLSTRCYYVKQ